MKGYLIIFVVLITIQSYGQDYKLINRTSNKLFISEITEETTYSLAIESATTYGLDSVYYNFFELDNDMFISDSCEFWGGPECVQQNRAGWIGSKIICNNSNNYTFFNEERKQLNFSFQNMVDTTLIYSDSSQVFSMLYEKTDTLTILNQIDSARIYKIVHQDINGNSIPSNLNNQSIIIGKQFGMTHFFVIDSFPAVLEPIQLIGNESPNAGIFQITNKMVYDHQAGDAIQFNEYSHQYNFNYPPWYNYNRYRKLIFISRTETSDSLIYSARQELFYEDSIGIEIDTISLKYFKSSVIAEMPFEKFNGARNEFYLNDYCGNSRWTYSSTYIEDRVFCEADTCWGTGDLGRPPVERTRVIVFGLGVYRDDRYLTGPDGYTKFERVVYYKKDGMFCGDEVVVGVAYHPEIADGLKIFPNPANTEVTILSPVVMKQVLVFNALGTKLFQERNPGSSFKIYVNDLESGVYYVKLLLANNTTVTKKLIISHH